MKKTTKRFAVGTIVAAAAGYLAGILTAPKSGKETRQDIRETAEKTVQETEKQLKKLHTELSDLLLQAKSKADHLSGKAKEEMDVVVKNTHMIKEKAREILSAVHEGDADDKDLKKAVQDSQKAIEHLKSYLAKR
jgi:gas vesicle protein